MKALAFALTILAALGLGMSPSKAAPCSFSNPSACGSPGMNQIAVANGGSLNGTFSGSPTFSGAVTFSGVPLFTGLSTGTQVSCLGLDSGGHLVLSTPGCGTGGGGGITQLTGDVTAGPGSGSVASTLATVNGNVGSFTNANITVNAKGLVTAAANGTAGTGSTLTFGTHLTGGSYNGGSPITIGTDAASANTVGTIVARDGSGNFSAGTITGSLTGHASLDLPLTGGTLTGKLNTVISGTGAAGFNLPPGAAPTSPVNGDLWMTSAGLFGQVAGSTVGPYGTGGGGGGNVSNSGTPVANQLAQWVSSTAIQGLALNATVGTALGSAPTGTGSIVLATSPTLVTPALGTPTSGNGSNLTNISLTSGVAGILPGANGGTGIANTGKTLTLGGSLTTTGAATPTMAFGASTFTYTFPGATANLGYQVGSITTGHCLQASGTAGGFADAGAACGSGGSVSITSLTPNIVMAPSPITGTGTISSTVPLNTQSGASYAILTGDNTQLVEMTNASATTMTIPVANSAGFLSGWGTNVLPTLAATVLTPASGTACGLASVSLDPGQFLGLAAGASTNYDCALGIPTSGTQNKVLATPNGSTGQPKLRALVAADIPSIPISTGVSGLGTNVATALAATLSAAGGLTSTIAKGTSAMGTSAISSGACATDVTTSATNVATTDVVGWGFNGKPTAVTGYAPATSGMLTVIAWPSANNVNFSVCNNTTASITPGAITLNWSVVR